MPETGPTAGSKARDGFNQAWAAKRCPKWWRKWGTAGTASGSRSASPPLGKSGVKAKCFADKTLVVGGCIVEGGDSAAGINLSGIETNEPKKYHHPERKQVTAYEWYGTPLEGVARGGEDEPEDGRLEETGCRRRTSPLGTHALPIKPVAPASRPPRTTRLIPRHHKHRAPRGVQHLELPNIRNADADAAAYNMPIPPWMYFRLRRVSCRTATIRGARLGAVAHLWFLDDGCLAGHWRAVAAALRTLQTAAARIGLTLNTSKCELILASAGAASAVELSSFPPDITVIRDGNFELLGAPVGDAQYCASYTAERVAKAEPRLDALAELDDPHVAFQLLRNCASFGRVIYSMRVTPPDWHQAQLQAFDSAVRRCFEQFSGVHCDGRQWRQATLGIRNAGLGLRDAARHSPAAYVASRGACAEQCRDVDPAHTWDGDAAGSHVARAVSALNAEFLESDMIPSPVPLTMRQQRLSLALDRAVLKELQGPAASLSQRAHLQLELAEGAGAWLNAMPSSVLGTHVHAQLFRIMLRRRLRVRVFDRSFHCPCCDSVMDMCGDHALACGGGG
eukprot:gene22046-biopygen46842